jgi:MarR family transcriptional regulator, negative regulator of the multidrug operon emrRAB
VSTTRLANLVGAIALAVDDAVAVALAGTGVGGTDAAALATLETYSDRVMTIERLRQVLGLSHPAGVRLVDRLCERQLARREVGRDKRERAVRLTPVGRRLSARIARERLDVLEEMLADLTRQERLQLERTLEKLLRHATASRTQARRICRFCDHQLCSANHWCPVDVAATRIEAESLRG